MNPIIQDKIDDILFQFDKLNDQFYLAVKQKDTEKMDRIGRHTVLLGKVIKDTAHGMDRISKAA